MSTTKNIAWTTGTGNITVTYNGSGDGTITVTSDANNLHSVRSQPVNVRTTDGRITRTVSISQAAKPYIDLSTAVVTAATQTYSGSALTPTPTVTLNGSTVPSTGYDVTYSNNTNAGTATITITGKGDYTGTASGNFTINKGTGTVQFGSSAISLGYDGGSTGTVYVRAVSGCGWAKTSEKSVSGYNVYKSVSNYNQHGFDAVMELTFVNSTGSAISTTFKVGPATEGQYDYTYITQWDSTTILYSGSQQTSQWTDVAVTIPTGTHTIRFVYKKDSSVSNSPDCGYVAIPYDVSFTSVEKNMPKYFGSGSFTWSSSNTSVATVNSSGQVTVVGTGTTTISVSMAANSNCTGASSSYTLTISTVVPIGNVSDMTYTGTVQVKTLSPGTYNLQVWGAQGGSNASDSNYGITSKAGGKGGYSTGVFTTANEKTVYAFVGGQGSSGGNGGWNGGGGGSGSSYYSSGDTFGISRMGCGGGATDIALVTSGMSYSSYRTNRSSASLLSRMIVAGGGSGGAMCYMQATTTSSTTVSSFSPIDGFIPDDNTNVVRYSTNNRSVFVPVSSYRGGTCTIKVNSAYSGLTLAFTTNAPAPSSGTETVYYASGCSRVYENVSSDHSISLTVPSDANYLYMYYKYMTNAVTVSSVTLSKTTTSTSTDYQVGYAGGGTTGKGYSSSYYGNQTAAGSNGAFGLGANQTVTNYRYASGCGGGGWYGGGSAYSDSSTSYVRYMGGGSGWVNTSASASNRPSGYTGLQLDSGTTYAGDTSFPAPGGGNETGHSGNGYARITRIS